MRKIICVVGCALCVAGCANPHIKRIDAWHNQKTGVITLEYVKHGVTNPNTHNIGYRVTYLEFHESEIPCKK